MMEIAFKMMIFAFKMMIFDAGSPRGACVASERAGRTGRDRSDDCDRHGATVGRAQFVVAGRAHARE